MPLISQAIRYLALCLWLAPFAAHALIGTSYQMQLGNPSGATADTNNHDHYLIQRTVEALDYSDNLGEPNWASWDLTASDVGTNVRSSFITDTSLPPNFNWITTGNYTGSGYDRGHLCPSKDRTDTAANNDLVFLMSNVLPQDSINNSGVWLQFENYCRALAQTNELLITCGPSGFGTARIKTNGPVYIPSYVWKIAVVVPLGDGMAVSRITNSTRVIAVKIPNTDEATNSWPFYVTSANQIQVDTGLTFFTALPADLASELRAKVDGQTNPPPVIFAFSPTNGTASNTVLITGTNFASASAVTFNGASATFTVDTGSQITASVPTNAGSGFISITTPSGTAISTNTFTVLNNGGTVYSGILAAWDTSGLPGGLNNYGPSPFAATTNAANLSVVGLTRGSGVKTSGTAAAGGWGGVAFTNANANAAVASNQFVTFSITASNGYKVSYSSVSRLDYYRSGTSPTNGVLQFQVGSGTFTDVTNLYYSTISAGASIGVIDLSPFAALQNVGDNNNVTFRIVNFGGTSSSGTWYIYNKLGTTAPDFAIQGTVTQVLTTNVPTLSISLAGTDVILSWPSSFTGFALQQNADLSTTNWTNCGLVVGTNGGMQSATNLAVTGTLFFRLYQP